MGEPRTEFKLKTHQEDGITNVTFIPDSFSSCWDKFKTDRLYNIFSNTQRLSFTHSMPVLDNYDPLVS